MVREVLGVVTVREATFRAPGYFADNCGRTQLEAARWTAKTWGILP